MEIGIIGLGLIGGSFGLSLKKNGHSIMGYDHNKEHLQKALELGIIDKASNVSRIIDSCTCIIIAIPVNATKHVVYDVLNKINPEQVVLDVGSTKAKICSFVKDHRNRASYVAAHPMAGTEYTGPEAAIDGLFKGKVNIICDRELASIDALSKAMTLFESVGLSTIYMDSVEHDEHIAYVSHLSHITSFTLSLTVQDIEQNAKNIYNMAGSGFRSTARLAKSNADMWTPILINNKENLLVAAKAYQKHLESFIKALENADSSNIHDLILEANKIQDALDK